MFKNLIKNFFKIIIQIYNWDKWQNISWSQEGEDLILARIFENQNEGFYVDIGAHHPKRFSNTYKFYKKGWRGINIDPCPGIMKKFNKERPNDINLEIGISDKSDILNYYIFNEKALNSFDEKLSLSRVCSNYWIEDIKKIQVVKLEMIFEKYLQNKMIDFLTIDVEGLDLEVLKSNNWEKFRPRFILVESLDQDLKSINDSYLIKYMQKLNYDFFAKTFNTIFFKNNLTIDQ